MMDKVRDVFFRFSVYFDTYLDDLFSLGSAEAYIGWGRKLNSHLMASCVRNILTKYCQNLVIGFQVTVKNVRDVFLRHSVCSV